MTDMIWSFAPWMVFLTGVRVGNVYWGAGVGAVVAIVVLARALSRHKAHLFDYVGVVYFVGLLALLAGLHPSDIGTWGRYAQPVAHGSLCVIVFASVLVNRPFTEAYAREQAPKEIWDSPGVPGLQPEDLHRLGFRLPARDALHGPGRGRPTPVSSCSGSSSPSERWAPRTPTATERAPRPRPATLPRPASQPSPISGGSNNLELYGNPEHGLPRKIGKVVTFDAESPATQFVGRGAELSVIATSAEAAMTGRPGLVWIEGVAGSGKTTLLRHALAGLPDEFVTVRAYGDELASDIPYQLAAQLGAASRESPFATGQELLDIWSGLQEQGPAAVVIEDVHWADRASALAVMSAVKRLDHDRALVIITSRPSPDEDWDRLVRDEERCHRLALGSFDADEVAALARHAAASS